jgi:hypothetical protein
MEKFLAIYFVPPGAVKQMAHATDEERRAGMDAWAKWSRDNAGSIVDLGAPLGKTKRVTAAGISDTTNEIGAYTIVQAESHDAAAALFENHPHFMLEGASIEIMEFLPVPSM